MHVVLVHFPVWVGVSPLTYFDFDNVYRSLGKKKEVKTEIESRTSKDQSGEVKVAKIIKEKKLPYFIKPFLFLIPVYTYYLMKGNMDVGNRKQIIIAASNFQVFCF